MPAQSEIRKPSEAELALQDLGHQPAAAVGLHPVPAVVRDHHRPHPRLEGGHVRGQEQAAQLRLRDLGVAAVDGPALGGVRLGQGTGAEGRAAVADEMLRAGDDALGLPRARRPGTRAPRPRPARATARGSRRSPRTCAPSARRAPPPPGREGPLDAGGAHLAGGDLGRLLHQRRVARAAEADVVREHGGPHDVGMAVHGVDAVEDRDLQARAQGVGLVGLVRGRSSSGRCSPRAGPRRRR